MNGAVLTVRVGDIAGNSILPGEVLKGVVKLTNAEDVLCRGSYIFTGVKDTGL